MVARRFKYRIGNLLMTGLLGSIILCSPAWAQDEPTVSDALSQAREAGVPETLVSEILARVYDAAFQPPAAAGTLLVLAQARQLQFDLDPFRARIEEGIAKRVEGNRLVSALEKRLERQILVSEQLQHLGRADTAPDPKAAAALADGLEMGLTPAELGELLQQAGEAPLAMAAVAAEMWALLKQLDFDPLSTNRILQSGFAHQAFKSAWRHFPHIVVIARQKGVPDAAIGAEALKRLQAGGDPADLLVRLGFTGRNLRTGPLDNH